MVQCLYCDNNKGSGRKLYHSSLEGVTKLKSRSPWDPLFDDNYDYYDILLCHIIIMHCLAVCDSGYIAASAVVP